MRQWPRRLSAFLLIALGVGAALPGQSAASSVEFPGPAPGAARMDHRGNVLRLGNHVIAESWQVIDGHLRPVAIENRLTGARFLQAGREVFRVSITPKVASAAPMQALVGSSFSLAGRPRMFHFGPDPHAARTAEHIGGAAVEADLVSPHGVRVHWRAEVRDGSNYIHQSIALSATGSPVTLQGVELADIAVPHTKTIGTAPGCPVAGDGLFFGVEMPGAKNTVSEAGSQIGFDCQLPLTRMAPYEFGAVIGVAPLGQLRRSFLFYLERERARPSQPFLHYNDWYDLGPDVTEKTLIEAAAQIHAELTQKRGVPIQSYLVDDGWDDPMHSLWQESPTKFPSGFRGLAQKLKGYHTHMSLWISPLGGYSYADERTAHARAQGLIPATGELDLADPAYKKWFEDRCLQLMREDSVNGFKWDRAGDGVSPHFMALLDIAHRLHRQNPAVFLNVTVGTWPSPFWLNHIDSTWRTGSEDVGWAGKGNDREKWITYRDGYCHKLFVEASPLYPLNSVMHHGIVEGRLFAGERVGKAGPNLKNEARSYFATGTMLQELYITPSMMTPAAWDCVADAAKWAHANTDVLVDAHWVGGDPLKSEPYGYAGWNRRRGTLMVRNPDAVPRRIRLDAATVFELPAGAPQRYVLRSPYPDQRIQALALDAGHSLTLTLEPFEVLVFNADPVPASVKIVPTGK